MYVEHTNKNIIKFRKQTNNKGEVIVIKKDKSKKKLLQMRTTGALQNGLPKPQEKGQKKSF
jgi:hypothetical protein